MAVSVALQHSSDKGWGVLDVILVMSSGSINSSKFPPDVTEYRPELLLIRVYIGDLATNAAWIYECVCVKSNWISPKRQKTNTGAQQEIGLIQLIHKWKWRLHVYMQMIINPPNKSCRHWIISFIFIEYIFADLDC